MWDPKVYLRYADERGRPFHELIRRVDATAPRSVVDLGCGPGNLTETLPRRWPQATVVGIDSSAEMIAAARDSAAGRANTTDRIDAMRLSYEIADVRDYMPIGVDVLITNAMLQWIPDHQPLVARWAAALNPGGWLALQVPASHGSPSQVAIRALCAEPAWADRLAPMATARTAPTALDYARLLRTAGCTVDAWETTYVHQLAATDDGTHPVLAWLSGTGLRPIRAVLTDAEWATFCAQLSERLAADHPVHDGVVDFPFARVFAVGHRR
jgi:trans-aconitate 2-methyltransferase